MRTGSSSPSPIRILPIILGLGLTASIQLQSDSIIPSDHFKVRMKPVIEGVLAAWNHADVVCLGEDHGGKNDSDLRIALIEHPDFARRVKTIIVEFAATSRQDLLDRFVQPIDLRENGLRILL